MGLSPQQIRAAELLSQGHSHQEVGDAVKVSRRTILRWLKQPDFKNLSYGLVGRATPPQHVQAPQRSSERRSASLTVSDLIPDALLAVRDILQNPESRSCDRIKAAALIGQWAGLGQPAKMVEMQALQVLIESNWVPNEVLEVLIDSSSDMEERVKGAFYNCYQNGHKKALPQESLEEGTVVDDDDELDE